MTKSSKTTDTSGRLAGVFRLRRDMPGAEHSPTTVVNPGRSVKDKRRKSEARNLNQVFGLAPPLASSTCSTRKALAR